MWSPVALLLLPSLLAISLTRAYKIHSSCSSYYELVHDSIEAAFSMAAAAEAALRDPLQRNPDDFRLAKLLLIKGGTNAQDFSTDGAWRSYKGLADVSSIITERLVADTREAIIYCNLDRLTKRPDGRWYDSDMNVLIRPDEVNELINPGFELASTFRHGSNKYPSQITINTWFLQWAYHARYRRWNDWSLTAAAANIAMPFATRYYPYTPIDAVTLLDKVMLHELTHTRAGGSTLDVSPEVSFLDIVNRFKYGGRAYGWRKAKFLTGHAGDGHAKSPQNNADSLALFASGVRLRQLAPPKYIADNGYIASVRPQQKRSAQSEHAQMSPKVLMDGFVTMIRGRQPTATSI